MHLIVTLPEVFIADSNSTCVKCVVEQLAVELSCLCLYNDPVHVPADNLEVIGSDYYKRRTLYFTVGENDPLYKQCFARQVLDADNPQAKRQKH